MDFSSVASNTIPNEDSKKEESIPAESNFDDFEDFEETPRPEQPQNKDKTESFLDDWDDEFESVKESQEAIDPPVDRKEAEEPRSEEQGGLSSIGDDFGDFDDGFDDVGDDDFDNAFDDDMPPTARTKGRQTGRETS